jgi:hypothetical protein
MRTGLLKDVSERDVKFLVKCTRMFVSSAKNVLNRCGFACHKIVGVLEEDIRDAFALVVVDISVTDRSNPRLRNSE